MKLMILPFQEVAPILSQYIVEQCRFMSKTIHFATFFLNLSTFYCMIP